MNRIRRTKEEADETRKLLINSALKVFSNKGYASATLNDIAQEAGVSRGAVYWHFQNKDDLYISMVSEYLGRAKKMMNFIDDSGNTPIKSLKEWMYRRICILLEDEEMKNWIEVLRYKTEVKTQDKLFEAQKVIDNYFIEEALKFVQLGIKTGEIRDDLDPVFVSTAALIFINGIEDTYLFNAGLFCLEDYLPRLLELFFTSIVNPNFSEENNYHPK